jgi:hypothetical protein
MQITAPYGYGEVVPLQKNHKVLMPAGTTPIFCRTLNALAVSFSEFAAAARDYPIVFVSSDGGGSFAPLLVLGLADGCNLFVNAAGDWDPGVYLPAFVRRYPFCISKVYVDGKPRGERVICVAKAYLDEGGFALFDTEGRPTERWQAAERLIADYEADLDRTAQMCAALARLQILAPFSMQVVEDSRPATRLAGMFRVDEAKLAALRPAAHKALVTKGMMGRVYAHLHSLQNFSRLYARECALRAPPAARRG